MGHRQSNALVIENPNLESLPEALPKQIVENNETSNSGKKEQQSTPVKNSLPVNTKQIETRTSDGRRRITPIFVAPAPDIGLVEGFSKINQSLASLLNFILRLHRENPTPFKAVSVAAVPFSSSCEEKSSIVVEKREDIIVEPNVTNRNSSATLQEDKEMLESKQITKNEWVNEFNGQDWIEK